MPHFLTLMPNAIMLSVIYAECHYAECLSRYETGWAVIACNIYVVFLSAVKRSFLNLFHMGPFIFFVCSQTILSKPVSYGPIYIFCLQSNDPF
jgi:hypothetical protein